MHVILHGVYLHCKRSGSHAGFSSQQEVNGSEKVTVTAISRRVTEYRGDEVYTRCKVIAEA
jgi:hypothetical protein